MAREIPERVEAVAARLGISDVLDKFPYQMSGGQKQRVAVALSVVSDVMMLTTGYQIGTALAVSLGFVIVLYGGYFLVTYLTSKGMLLRERAHGHS